MEATGRDGGGDNKKYKTEARIQAWFLGRSRDGWKKKYMKLKGDVKRLKNRVHDVTRSREQWREKAESREAEKVSLREKAERLEAEVAALREANKNKRGPRGDGGKTAIETHSRRDDAPVERALATVAPAPAVANALALMDDGPVADHGYGAGTIALFLSLVLKGTVSLRAAPRVMAVVGEFFGSAARIPHWTTLRRWMQRIGLAALADEKGTANDWAWLIDHSTQIGQEKCLVILGVRLVNLPKAGQCLGHKDMELIALVQGKNWTGASVDAALEAAAKQAGHAPRVIVSDHGSDLKAGINLFQRRRPETAEVYDAKHKAACLMRALMEKDARWAQYQALVGKARCALRQTESACLSPAAPKSKARFMNMGPQLKWGGKMLKITRRAPESLRLSITPERLKERLGWIETFAEDLDRWTTWQSMADATVALVNREGIRRGVARLLWDALPRLDRKDESARRLGGGLLWFVRSQERQARPGERFPGSTEVLESCFGKFKQLEKQQARGGFTGLLAAFGSMLVDVTKETAGAAMRSVRTKDVKQWLAANLGTTLFAQRKLAFAGATETG